MKNKLPRIFTIFLSLAILASCAPKPRGSQSPSNETAINDVVNDVTKPAAASPAPSAESPTQTTIIAEAQTANTPIPSPQATSTVSTIAREETPLPQTAVPGVSTAPTTVMPVTIPVAAPEEPAPAVDTITPPLWEKARPEGKQWTKFATEVIEKDGMSLLAGSRDIEQFCPRYGALSQNEKVGFWVYLVSAVVKFESGFSPVARMQETTMGIDPITKLPVQSEGLLQLSYQDVLAYPYCNEFDWSVDQHLAVKDPAKTILNPEKNLRCGIRILNQQLRKKSLIEFRPGNYWAVLMPRNRPDSPVEKIKALSRATPMCARQE